MNERLEQELDRRTGWSKNGKSITQAGGPGMRITSKGQVTIPIEIRERLGLMPGSEVEFQIQGNAVRIVKAKAGASRGQRVVDQVRGKGSVKLSTDQILALTRSKK